MEKIIRAILNKSTGLSSVVTDKTMSHKIDQIAFYTPDPEMASNWLASIGCSEWSIDFVTAVGEVFGVPVENFAELWFNHQLGIELELIRYVRGANWHSERAGGRQPDCMFLSHLGCHVEDATQEAARYLVQGIQIAQEVLTIEHTNPEVLRANRRYHYIVLSSRYRFGFDLKLIERLTKGAIK